MNRALTHRIASIDVVESSGALTVLPSAGAVLGFQFRGRVRAGKTLLAQAGVTGLQDAARNYSYDGAGGGNTGSVLVRFTPQGTACLGVSADELANRSVALGDLLPAARVARVCERLQTAGSNHERVAIVEAFLVELPFAADPLVARALRLLETTAGEEVAVAAVARALGLSERQLERRFLQRVGVTPKRFATLRRFERAVALARTAPSLTSAALDAGYYDQSHFIRAFRRFTGASPRGFFRTSR
jgi:AraC-like DNA-binding protein